MDRKQTVFLMRHGARHDAVFPQWKATASRPYDTPLSRRGHYETPKLVHERLLGKNIDAVISSPFLRCIQTATHAYTVLGLPGLHTCNQLSEFLVPDNAMSAIPQVPATKDAKDTVFLSLDTEPLPKFPETRTECITRYKRALDSLADKYWPQTLLLVTHQLCVQEAANWGGKEMDVEAVYCAHVELSRDKLQQYNWTWKEDCGIFTYDSVL